MLLRAAPLVALLGTAVAAADGPAYLVRDLRTVPTAASSNPRDFTTARGQAYFFAADALWRSDAISAEKVADLFPGGALEDGPRELTGIGDAVLFVLGRPDTGSELWCSDGSTAGTVLLADINPGAPSSSPSNLVAAAGRVFFIADDGSGGRELWRSDGTPSGTARVIDLDPGKASSEPRALTAFGDGVAFVARASSPEFALWLSDGTAAGTRPVGGLDGVTDLPYTMTAIGDALYFVAGDAAGRELWRADPDGRAHRVADLAPGPDSSWPGTVVDLHGVHYFFASDAEGRKLWRTDGTEAGTVGFATEAIQPGNLVAAGDLLYFTAREPMPRSEYHPARDLWRSDGTAAGTYRIAPLIPDAPGGPSAEMVPFRDGLLFSVHGGLLPYGNLLGRSDGTAAGTQTIRSGGASGLTVIGDFAYFAGDSELGSEPWRSDGTADGTVLLRDIATGASAYPSQLAADGSGLLFVARGDDSRPTLWHTDGTAAGTVAVDLAPATSLGAVLIADDLLYFTASSFPTELWVYEDGAARFLVMLGTDGALLGARGRELLFRGADSSAWWSDGTPGGVFRLGSSGGSAPANPAGFARLDAQVCFVASGPQGRELWRTDGTPSGTSPVADIAPGAADANPFGLTVAGRALLFSASDTPFDTELWRSDGSAAGTRRVRDINPGPGASLPSYFAALPSGVAVFIADDGRHGFEPWRTDGTEPGTFSLGDLRPGGDSSVDPSAEPRRRFAVAGRWAYFVADDGLHGLELWRTDGSVDHTELVRDLVAGAGGAFPSATSGSLGAVGPLLLFTAYSPDYGWELWRSDGSTAGTRLLQDIDPGPASANPGGFTPAGAAVYFAADQRETGNELWAVARSALASACVGDCDGSGAVDIGDLVAAVATALDASAHDCVAADCDLDGAVTITELTAAVRRALDGCD